MAALSRADSKDGDEKEDMFVGVLDAAWSLVRIQRRLALRCVVRTSRNKFLARIMTVMIWV